jgi:glutamate synthase domain-containing protein 2
MKPIDREYITANRINISAWARAMGLDTPSEDDFWLRVRNYPVIGHVRFLFEWVRPEIRQYLLESDREAAPFSRQQRSLVYQRSKGESDKRPFGTQLDVGQAGYEWINHSLKPSTLASHDFRVRIGGDRCTQP